MTDKWQTRKRPGPLGPKEAHLWIASLSSSKVEISQLESILSNDERERAHRFKKSVYAERYTAARGLLRVLLGAYLELEPRSIRFTYDALGKPHLAHEAPPLSLNFNVSHSDELALFGFVREYRIGVDLERIDSEVDFGDLVERYFSVNEIQKLRALPPGERQEAFYRGWTRKEAYLKARGEGLSYPLERVEVSLAANEPAMILRADDDPFAAERWTIQSLSPAPGYIGTAAVEATNLSFGYFKWDTSPGVT